MFKKQPKYSLGLEISTNCIKLALLEISPLGIVLKDFLAKEIPESQKNKPAFITQTLFEFYKNLNQKEIEIFLSLSGAGIFIKHLSIPRIPEKEILNAVRWELKTHIPFPIESVDLAYYILEKTEDKFEIIAAVVQKDLLSQSLKPLQNLVSGATTSTFALWEIVSRTIQPKKDEIVGLIDMGAEITTLSIIKNNLLQFTREISLGGNNLTKIMSGVIVSDQWQLNLTPLEAEALKIEFGIPPEDTEEKTERGVPLKYILETLRPVLRRFLNELLRSFDYYREQFHESKIDKIYLTGGSSSLKNLPEFLAAGTGTEVQVLNILQNIHFDPASPKALELKETAPRLTVAIGAALDKGSKINFIKKIRRTNLLPQPKFKRIEIPASRKLIAGILISIIVTSLSGYIFLDKVNRHYQSLIKEKQQILRVARSLVEKRNILKSIVHEKNELSYFIEELSSRIPSSITLNKMAFNNSDRALNINGFSPNLGSVIQLMNNIKNSKYFSNVNLIRINKVEVTGTTRMLFEITFNLNE